MSIDKHHHELFSILRETPDYWLDLASMEFTGDLQRILDYRGMSYGELARRAGTSQPYISKVFAGATNFTLKTMLKFAKAVGAVLHVRLTMEHETVRVRDIYDTAATSESSPAKTPLVSANAPFSRISFAALADSQLESGTGYFQHAN